MQDIVVAQAEKGIEPLDLAEVERKTSGDSRRPSWRAWSLRLQLKYYMKRALKRLMNPEPYYPDPSIESSYRTCDSRAY